LNRESLRIVLRAAISPSEDRDKVISAATGVLGKCEYEMEEGEDSVTLRSSHLECLQMVHDQLRDRHVRDAARRRLLKSIDGNRMTLLLNRQAAFIGIVAVVAAAEESPLGPLVLEMECDKPEELMDWLTLYRAEEPRSQAHP
jgi:predicted RNA binding protein with dsRBD fold (UPF0201 family)